MHGRDDAFAWRLYGYNWMVIAPMGLALVAGMMLRGFSLAPALNDIKHRLVSVAAKKQRQWQERRE